MKTSFLINFFILIFFSSIHAQTLEKNLDHIFDTSTKNSICGISILISKKGKIIYENHAGMANVEYNIPISEKTKFPIGSITKQFTAAGILILEEQGKLDIKDPISTYLKGFEKDYKNVNIQHLLTHTSGIKDYPRVQEIRNQIRRNLSPKQILEFILKEEMEFEAGNNFSYSNTGYIILGLIIEKVSGLDYSNFMKQEIFEPYGMNNTEVNNYQAIINDRAIGYSEDEYDHLIHATHHTSSFSAGAIISTGRDLHNWMTNLNNGVIIPQQKLDLMFSNHKLKDGQQTNNGFGWEMNQIANTPCFEHSGFIPGYKANSIYIPKYDVYITVFGNNEYGSPTPLMLQAAAIMINKPYPNLTQAKNPSLELSKKIEGVYNLSSGEDRIIYRNEDGFSIKAHNGNSSKLYVMNDSTLFYQEGYRQIHFIENSKNQVVSFTFQNRLWKQKAIKTSNKVPKTKELIIVNKEVLATYVGVYQFEPFKLFITLEDNSLFVQPDGSNKVPLSPTSKNTFTISQIGAEISFSKADKMEALLLMEGDTFKGIRKD